MRREERDPAWLADMLQAAREARLHAGQMNREEFLADLRTQRAVELMIVIIGEAAAQVSEESRARRGRQARENRIQYSSYSRAG